MKNQCPTSDELRAFGFDVRIQHHRVFNEIGQWEPDGQGIDNVLTRGEYNRAKQSAQLDFSNGIKTPERYARLGFNLPEEVPYGHAVSPTGGFTTVTLKSPDGVEMSGKFNFGRNEPFNRNQGVRAALNRAMFGSRSRKESVQTEVSVES